MGICLFRRRGGGKPGEVGGSREEKGEKRLALDRFHLNLRKGKEREATAKVADVEKGKKKKKGGRKDKETPFPDSREKGKGEV